MGAVRAYDRGGNAMVWDGMVCEVSGWCCEWCLMLDVEAWVFFGGPDCEARWARLWWSLVDGWKLE